MGKNIPLSGYGMERKGPDLTSYSPVFQSPQRSPLMDTGHQRRPTRNTFLSISFPVCAWIPTPPWSLFFWSGPSDLDCIPHRSRDSSTIYSLGGPDQTNLCFHWNTLVYVHKYDYTFMNIDNNNKQQETMYSPDVCNTIVLSYIRGRPT